MTRRIIQFGTSRFLQAHVDLFVHEARVAGQAIGPITVVKTTSGQDRAGRVQALKRGVPFSVRIRGVEAGARCLAWAIRTGPTSSSNCGSPATGAQSTSRVGTIRSIAAISK